MIYLISSLWVAVIAIHTCQCRPSASLENDKSDKFGYNYKVSHSPGASNVHLSFGRSKHDQKSYDIPARDRDSYHGGSSPSKSYQPEQLSSPQYYKEDGVKSYGKPDPPVYQPSVSSGSRETYSSPYDSDSSSPYDSDRKHNGDGYSSYGDAHRPKNYQSVPQNPTPNFHPGSVVSESPERHYPQHDINTPSHYSNPTAGEGPSFLTPTSQNHIDVPVDSPNPQYSVQSSNPAPYPQEEIRAPEETRYLNSAHQLPQPVAIPQQSSGVPPYSNDPNLNGPSSQPVPVSQHDISVAGASGPLSHSNEPLNGPYNGPIQSPPVGAKYAIVPSGLSYTRDTFTADIIHGPQTGESIPVSGAPVYETNKPAPVSHSIALPYSPSAPYPNAEKTPSENLPLSFPDSSSKTLTPSHSTQLLIPSAVSSTDSAGVKIVPNTNFQPQEKIEDLAPISHSTQLLIPSPALPSNGENHHIPSSQSINNLPPLSHSSQIILPVPLPQINPGEIKTVPASFADENGPLSAQEKTDAFGPISHSIQLPIGSKAASIESFSSPEQTVPDLGAIAPPSHSTKLLIPSDVYSSKTAAVPPIPPPLNVGYPNIGEYPSNSFPSHQVGIFSEGAPNPFASSPDVSSITHSFRLNVPQLTPGVLPVIPDEKPGENITPIVVDTPTVNSVDKIPPTSHSFKLILPQPYVLPDLLNLSAETSNKGESNHFGERKDGQIHPASDSVTLTWPPTEQDLLVPQVQYSEPSAQNENFKSSDVPLLAVETKKPRRKGRKLRKRS